ncbi:MAG: N-acetylglucosamine-6-phosphate deacetylase, partial [Clostridia bacterium]|nr:N-acetylglucosamine-6-phosphate deacetylase [Clostridia bacterium]
MKQLIHGKIVLPDRIIEDGSIAFSDKIEKILDDNTTADGAEIIDLKGATVIPGLIDLHIHGYL